MPADLARVKELFLAALEKPAGERATYLDSACGDDTALRNQIERMLATHANSGELLPRPAAEMLQSDDATQADATVALGQHAGESTTGITPSDNESDALPFLAAASQPGYLGRLGPYEVQRVLGKGGFGVVLKAFDERLHRVVAIKVLAPAYAAVGSARKRFIREARAAAAVKNEHVVGIHDVQEDAEPPYLVMEYIDGISLQDKIDKHGTLELKEILRIGMQIAEGLAAAHKQGLVHRDIKPANILLENGVERVKITDFGLARAVDDASVTQSGTVAGTPMYMSPEQAEGLPIDHRSDLFSLGTVLYAMCTGHPPFRASGTHAVLKRVIDANPRPIREINNELPDWLADIIAKLHAKKPDDRFQTAKEVAELLGQRLADVQAGRAIDRRAEGRQAPVEAPATAALDRPVTGLASPTRRRVAYAALSLIALSAAVLTITELTNITHFFHQPSRYELTFLVERTADHPELPTIRYSEARDNETPEEFAERFREMARKQQLADAGIAISAFGGNKLSLPAGSRWWILCEKNGELLYHTLVTVDRAQDVHLPWATAMAKRKEGWIQLFNGSTLAGWRPPYSSP